MKSYSTYFATFFLAMIFAFSIRSIPVINSDKCTYNSFYDSRYMIGDKLLIPEIPLVLCPPYFEQQITSDSLKVVVEFLETHTKIKVELRSHTDFRDSDSNNYALCQRRAKQYCDYIVTMGIESKRITPIAMGESEPFIIGKCFHVKHPQFEIGDTLNEKFISSLDNRKDKEAAHAINRRNEIVIVGIIEE